MGHGDERIVLVLAEVFFLWVVQVDGPGRKHAAIREFLFGDNVRLAEDDISDDLLGFSSATDVGEPLELSVGVTLLQRVVVGEHPFVFDAVPSTEGGEQVPVADFF